MKFGGERTGGLIDVQRQDLYFKHRNISMSASSAQLPTIPNIRVDILTHFNSSQSRNMKHISVHCTTSN